MEIIKYSDFVNEARVNKDEVVDALLKMFKSKPKVKMTTGADEKGLYSLAGMKTYLDKYPSLSVGNALGDIQNDKSIGIKAVSVKVSAWKKSLPYWYLDMSADQVAKMKAEYEEEEEKKNPEKPKAAVVKKGESEKPAAKKPTTKGVERKAGAPAKKPSTRTTKKK